VEINKNIRDHPPWVNQKSRFYKKIIEQDVIECKDISSAIQEGYQDSIPKFQFITQKKGDYNFIGICKRTKVAIAIATMPIKKRGIGNELKS
jgi:hypothetical protein